MKRLTWLIAFVLFSFVAYSQKKPKIVTVHIKTFISCDHCKTCETCEQYIIKDLFKIEGVRSVTVDTSLNRISVVFNRKKTTVHELRERIAFLGYPADHLSAVPEGVEVLEPCCRKR